MERLLSRIFPLGGVTVIDARGRKHESGSRTSRVTLRLHDQSLLWRAALQGTSLALGEGYMDGRITIESGTLYDLIDLLMEGPYEPPGQLQRWRLALHHWWHRNGLNRSRANVAHHYDLSYELYRRFLDSDLNYSCAVFADDNQDLERAQAEKQQRIARKLLLAPGQRVLDIGSGWGSLSMALARRADVSVLGVTLSTEQLKIARARAAAAGLADRVQFELMDYRNVTGRFDRIVSVGMFEHVGRANFPAYFAKIQELLTPDGVALVHAIGRRDGPGISNPWLDKYIFPGGYSPALSEVLPAVERADLWVTDIEILRLHYARTLRVWRQRFEAERAAITSLYDERFCRMWELYLIGSEMAFRRNGHMVWQMQIARDQRTVPLTRDYLAAPEAAPGRINQEACAPIGAVAQPNRN